MKKNLSYLVISLAISSGTMLTERFVISIPDWIAVLLFTISIIFLVIYIVKSSRNVAKSKLQ